jgi:phosphoglycerate dehydrogenase-like enzyme
MAFDTILVVYRLSVRNISQLQNLFKTVIYHPNWENPVADSVLKNVEVMLVKNLPKGLDSFSQTPNLKWIQANRAGVESLLDAPFIKDVSKNGVDFTTAAGIHAGVIPSYVIMMMHALHFDLQKQIMCTQVRCFS